MGNSCVPQPSHSAGQKHKARSIDSKKILMASLNYSGVQESPFQYYQNQNEDEKKLSHVFDDLCSKEYPKYKDSKFKWIMGRMDKDWHTRFSPLYNQRCGIRNKQLMTKQQFYYEWQQQFKSHFNSELQNKIYGKLSAQERITAIQSEKEQCKIFDYLAFRAIVQHVYKVQDISPGMSAEQYEIFQQKKFDQPFLNENLKIRYTIDSLKQNHFDVLFFQEANEIIIKEIKNKFTNDFQIVQRLKQNCTSVVMVNKKRFPQIKDFVKQNQKLRDEYAKKTGDKEDLFFFNSDSVFQAVGHTVFLSVHLSSKKEFNEKQINQMNQGIEKFLSAFPNYNIVIGSDLNGDYPLHTQLTVSGKKMPLSVFPDCKNDSTVMKKRTTLQVQKHKANQLNTGAKDYFVSTLKISGAQVQTIKGEQIKKGTHLTYLPNSNHPYDHYLLTAFIQNKKEYF